ncbi:periplasmic binding protein [Jimgerdemannia flammicorona]|uniref:Periplasmic binding protein n=1 Tax=Jimgerdemannia flammicorona TaxID=994334 RepID=A0A433QXT6_9FUNG|nr:periplasmic binding protein [Jimgerdemannia flammicorona]
MGSSEIPLPPPRITMPVNFYGLSVYRQFYMQTICVFLVLTALIVVPTSAQQNSQQCVTTYNAQTDYFPAKIHVDNATLFAIQYFNNYKLVSNKMTNEIFALYQCGTPAPTNLPNGTKVFAVPVAKVATLQTSSNTYLEALGVGAKIVALSVEQDVSSPCLQKGLANNSIIQISSSNATFMAQTLAQMDVVFGSPSASTSNNTRAEWVEFYSTWFNLEDSGNKISASINDNYNCLRRAAANINGNKPIVSWVSYSAPSEYTNNTPSWDISTVNFKMQLTADAGAIFFAPNTTKFSTSKDFLAAIQNVDVIIDETYLAPTLNDVLSNFGITNATASTYRFVANQAIFREDGIQTVAGGRDWYESAVIFDDAVLADVIAAVWPGYPTTGYQRSWLRNVAKGETPKISTAANCTGSVSTPRTDPAFACSGNFAAKSGASSVQAFGGFVVTLMAVAAAVLMA